MFQIQNSRLHDESNQMVQQSVRKSEANNSLEFSNNSFISMNTKLKDNFKDTTEQIRFYPNGINNINAILKNYNSTFVSQDENEKSYLKQLYKIEN